MSLDRQEVANRLHSAALHLVRTVRTVDAEMGLTPARASVLSVLVFGGPRTVGGLARAEGVRSPTVSALVNGLVDDGFARRTTTPDDARSVLVEATPKARRLLQRGRERRVAMLDGLLATLSPRDLAVLERAAELIEAAVGARMREPSSEEISGDPEDRPNGARRAQLRPPGA
jgi:DNA-binding MarR family transcriptional regulator